MRKILALERFEVPCWTFYRCASRRKARVETSADLGESCNYGPQQAQTCFVFGFFPPRRVPLCGIGAGSPAQRDAASWGCREGQGGLFWGSPGTVSIESQAGPALWMVVRCILSATRKPKMEIRS